MILVTGATGLLGSHLLQNLLQGPQMVKALYRSEIPQFEGSEKIDWIQGDILNVPTLEDALQNVALVYHCAAVVSFNTKDRDILYKTNVEGTANVVNACIKMHVEKLLYVSSVAALGKPKTEVAIDESSQWNASEKSSEYGRSKYLAEMEVWRGIGEGLEAAIVNPSIILGFGDWSQGSAQLFKSVYDEFPWYTDGVTGFVDVLDVVQAMILLMNSDVTAERFIINGDNISYRELFDKIADCFGKQKPHKQVTPLLASAIWRLEAFRSLLTGKRPLLTEETSRSAQAKVYFDNKKFLKAFPQFKYHSINESVCRICSQFKHKINKVN